MKTYTTHLRTHTLTNYELCDTSWKKARGMMLRSRKNAKTLVFSFSPPQRVGLHMLFVFFSITVAVLDGKKRIIEVKRLLPFEFFTTKKASYVVEFVGNEKINRGDTIRFK